MQQVYIVSIARTPMGSFGGSLASLSATELGSIAIKAAIERAGINAMHIQELLMGNVCSANLGQAPARQAGMGAGLLPTTICTTINKVCASGMKAITLGTQSIQLGYSDCVLAGGMESMSNIPYYLPNARWGLKFGAGSLIDGLQKDGLTDPFDKAVMGIFADQTAKEYNITREQQDEFAIASYTKSAQTTNKGGFKSEIVPVSVSQKKGDALIIDKDEEFTKVDFSKIPGLKPAFTTDGTVTAANASTINDGASALVLMSESKMKELNLSPIARIVSYADAEQEPKKYTTTPVIAAPLAAKRAGLKINEIDYFEVNEAFAVVPLVFGKLLEIDAQKINIHGGAVSLGHPLGSSGSRIVCTLSQVLNQMNGQYGLAAICNGGGGATAIVLERC
ncbi:MAG: acetyl-CoA C-acyltransferase [Saprospiraceae bacterium]